MIKSILRNTVLILDASKFKLNKVTTNKQQGHSVQRKEKNGLIWPRAHLAF